MLWTIYVRLNDLFRAWRLRLLRKLGKEPPHVSLTIHDLSQGQKEK